MLTIVANSQNDRKALVIRDTTPLFSELVVAEGWGTDFNFSDYIIAGTLTATLAVTKYSYDGTTETTTFDLTALGFFEGVVSQTELIYNLVIISGVLSLIETSAFDSDTAEELPDGIYTLVYTLTTSGADITTTLVKLLSDKAEYILEDKALNLDAKIFAANTTDLVQLVDINVLEAIMFAVNQFDTLSNDDVIINLLRIINNEEYEYYRE